MKLERYISPQMLEEQRALHASPKGYGGRGDNWAKTVLALAQEHHCKTVLDYGCGQGTLKKAINLFLHCSEYDPAIPGKDTVPKYERFDMVVCTDVLEHIERDRIAVVIEHLQDLTLKLLFMVIATRPSNKFFRDGTNVHTIIEPAEWWQPRLAHPSFDMLPAPPSHQDKPAREYVVLMQRKKGNTDATS